MLEYSRRMPGGAPAPKGPPPPPARGILFAYWNGEKEERDLPPAEVAERVRANAAGTNAVWASGFAGWKDAREVSEIADIIARMPPPPPR